MNRITDSGDPCELKFNLVIKDSMILAEMAMLNAWYRYALSSTQFLVCMKAVAKLGSPAFLDH